MVHKYNAKCEGKGKLIAAVLYLEKIPTTPQEAIQMTPILLQPKFGSGRKVFQRKNIEIDVEGQLDYMVVISGRTGTDWDFTLTNVGSGNNIIQLSGKTGDTAANKSVRSGSVNPA